MASARKHSSASAVEAHHGHGEHHDLESMRVMGFWLFLITDCIMFGSLFATYAVLSGSFAGGPTAAELFEMPGVIAETFILLTSSFTSGLAVLSMHRGNVKGLIGWLAVTVLLGASFITLEITEFVHLVHEGASISTSAHWSAFFTLVGAHGLHVTIGLVWMIAIMLQLRKHGINSVTRRKVTITSLYWHFLDVVWIFVFTIVYLLEVM
ncbi:MAG: cytochrome o ubiquinol oxidase subunit III [Candidatus Cohnella colombiensis]|uniref:Cytochrome bo(3) ubiquinol oxidase subunit 3 n=1 Tax=Candidatus Cohnella colombiensis TaxID=3121368 RepID=A0AA95EWF7_9BACL|nr:MAG: cytochrome o ubiquinol oxidase subunit III [Cohnella sp.]